MLAINPVNPVARLRYCFDFLEHAEEEIARDALYEFMKASDREVGLAARTLSASKVRRWLQDPKILGARRGIYALALGHCGTAHDAKLLRQWMVRLLREEAPGAMESLTGYVLLNPKDGWLFLRGLLLDKDAGFYQRYAALRALRYLHEVRPEVIGKQAIMEAMTGALEQADIADLIIDEFRHWGWWEPTSRILRLYDKRSHELPIIRRAILRYAADCPRPEAAEFIARHRKSDAEGEKLIQ
jgi:hypothetical protein